MQKLDCKGWTKSADNRRRVGHKKCSLPLAAAQTIAGGRGPRTTRCFEDASLNLFIVRACATQFVKNIGVFDSPGCAFASLAAPAAHRQHHLHHPHQRLPRMRMMQVMLGMLPMLVNPPHQFLVEIIYFPPFPSKAFSHPQFFSLFLPKIFPLSSLSPFP